MRSPLPAIGEVFNVSYPFCRETRIEQYADSDGMGEIKVPTWRPGVRNVVTDIGNEYSHKDHYLEADAVGAQLLTVVGVYRPGRFPTRVFYTRQWRDPEGRVFGKTKCRITTVPAFRGLTRGYRHPFELARKVA